MDLFYFVFDCLIVFLSVLCSLVDTCWEMADLLALLYVMFSCVFVTFPYGILDQVWYLIESIPDLCLLPNLYYISYVHIIMLRKGINIYITCYKK